MKHILSTAVILLGMSSIANASPTPLKPGLWEVTMKIKSGGKEMDPQAEIQKSMAKMSPEQRKQMEAMLAKSGVNVGLSGAGTRICYTKEMLDQPKNLGQDPNHRCETTMKDQTSSHMAMDFKCEDGSSGTGEWKFKSPTEYEGQMKFTKAGKISEIIHNGHFVSADCGSVKPFVIPKRQ